MKFNLDEIIKSTNAKVLKNTVIDKGFEISTDTRTIKNGEIYLPLRGVNFDGEKFLQDAINKGAEGCFISGDVFPDNAKLVLKVEDTKLAYMSLAQYIRNKFNPKAIAVTGSSGKTTTKEIIYSVLSQKFKTHKTFSNHNNEIGFCQTMMTMPTDCEILIIEMGMRGLGEIDFISKYLEPDFAVITNAGSAHIGRLGSLDNIAKAKAEVTKYIKPDGIFISQNNDRIKKFVEFEGEKIYYSLDDVEILERKMGYSKFIYKNKEYELNVEGDYNIENSLSAINLGYKLGMTYEEIIKGLASYKPIEKRWETLDINGYCFINDSYNANPESMKASVTTFLRLYNSPVVVLGDMGELGEDEVKFHTQVGEYFSNLDFIDNAKFLTVGNLASNIGDAVKKNGCFVKNFENNLQVSKYILDSVPVGTTIFLKASRSMKFEEIINAVKGEIKV